MHDCEVHTYEGFCEYLARQITVAHSVPAPVRVLASSHMGFGVVADGFLASVLSHEGLSHRRSVLKTSI
jgi:hypothetical protein